MKQFLRLFCASAALTAVSFAQNPNAPGQVKKTDEPAVDPIAVERNVIGNAFGLARTTDLKAGTNLAALEALLITLNQSQPGSAEWRIELAQRLMQTAEQLSRAGKPDNVPALATRALQHLAVADVPAHDAETRAAARSLSAWIYERYLADSDSAQTSYEGAAQLAPGNTKAKEAAERLKKTKDNVKQKPVRGS